MKYVIAILVLLLLILTPVDYGLAGQSEQALKLPLPAGVVLGRINPLLQNKAYAKAAEQLLAFQARGGPAPPPGTADPKGYHHPEIYYSLGNCYLLQEKYDQAAAAYDQAVARDASHIYAWLNLAKAHYEMKRYAEAGRCFGKAYDADEKKPAENLYYSAAAYLMAGDHEQCITLFERLLAAHPDDVQPQWKEHYVHALLASGQARRALPIIIELAGMYTGDKKSQWQEILLYQYVQLGMHKAALDLAQTLTDQAPTVAKWWKALAYIQLQVERNEAALASLTIYSFLTPLSLEEKKLLADLNLQSGVPVKAAPVYESCLEERSEKALMQRLAIAYRQMGRSDTALARIDAFKAADDDPDLLMLKAELLYSLKKYDQAAAAFKCAGRIEGRHAGRAWLMAGYAAWQMNDLPAGKESFVRAAKYRKEKKMALAALKQMSPVAVK